MHSTPLHDHSRPLRRTTIPGVLALTTIFLAAGCGEAPEDRAADRATPDAPTRGSIVEIAQAAGQFSALLRAVEAAGLTATLENDGPFTVFAPTDGTFAALPAGVLDSLMDDPDALGEVLLYHVVPGELTTRDLWEADRLETAQGKELVVRVTDQGVTINDTYLLTADIRAANGTIHVITSVLVPSGS